MGLVCKYWTMFLEFLKKKAHKIFWPDLLRKKYTFGHPGGMGVGAIYSQGPRPGAEIPGFPWKIMVFEQNCHTGVIYRGNMG